MLSHTLAHRLLLATIACLVAADAARAADWPQFRGPDCSGVSPETGLARTWPAGGPKVLWTLDVGDGFGGVAIRQGQAYLLDRAGDQSDVLRCLDLETGKGLWDFTYAAPGGLPYNGSRNVPTVDQRHIYTLGPFGHLYCIDRTSHQAVWSAHLVNDFKIPEIDRDRQPANRAEKLLRTEVPRWGLTQSPLIYHDLLIVAPQTQKVGLVAYDKATGKVRWTSPYIGRNWYAHVSPTLVTLAGADQIVMVAQPSDPEKSPAAAPPANICGIDPADGQILWTIQTPRPYKLPIPQPIGIGQDRLLITGGYGVGCLILQVHKSDGKWSAKWLSTTLQCASHIQSPVRYKDHIYVTSFREHGSPNTGLVCLDLEGGLCWQTGPGIQFDQGNFLIADGLALVLHGKTGELNLLEIGPAGFRPLAKAKVLAGEGGMVWAPMALSNGRLIIRDQHQIKCVEVGDGGPGPR